MWRPDGPQGYESMKVRWDIVPYTRGRGLDIGSGVQKPFAHFIGVDNGHHRVFGQDIRPDITAEADNLGVFASRSMDFVFSSHLLEHVENYENALAEWWRVIRVGGYLVLYLPHKDFYPNIGQPGANPDHKHDFLPQDIIDAMKRVGNGWTLLVNEDRNEGNEYSFFQVYRRDQEKGHRIGEGEKPEKTAAVVRYGAFGDLIQASTVFAALKADGHHVTLYTTPTGEEVARHDPNLDQIIVQDKDQVPNGHLVEFWQHLEGKYDKFINLSESVEGTFLALPGRANHRWPQNLRHKYMNRNYTEFALELSGVDVKEPKQTYYPTKEERAWARYQRDRMGKFVILWSLAGSSVHKTWPYLDQVIARLMLEYTGVQVVLVGDYACQILESGWENEKRVHRRSGVWAIRESLAFCEQADLIIGPETGVMNAAANLAVPKIVTLSHSSVENLTKHWTNTTSLTPMNTACHPCHRLHYGFEFCHRDDNTGTAKCQADISGDAMWEAIQKAMDGKGLERRYLGKFAS